jgi:hypothetical protein
VADGRRLALIVRGVRVLSTFVDQPEVTSVTVTGADLPFAGLTPTKNDALSVNTVTVFVPGAGILGVDDERLRVTGRRALPASTGLLHWDDKERLVRLIVGDSWIFVLRDAL